MKKTDKRYAEKLYDQIKDAVRVPAIIELFENDHFRGDDNVKIFTSYGFELCYYESQAKLSDIFDAYQRISQSISHTAMTSLITDQGPELEYQIRVEKRIYFVDDFGKEVSEGYHVEE